MLKSDGVLAIWGYDFDYLEPGSAAQGSIPDSDVAAANAAFTEFHSGTEGLGPYWAPGRALVEAWYAGLEPGSSHFKDVTWLPEGMAIREDMSLDHLVRIWEKGVAHLMNRAEFIRIVVSCCADV